jgi:hypothetical protein
MFAHSNCFNSNTYLLAKHDLLADGVSEQDNFLGSERKHKHRDIVVQNLGSNKLVWKVVWVTTQ